MNFKYLFVTFDPDDFEIKRCTPELNIGNFPIYKLKYFEPFAVISGAHGWELVAMTPILINNANFVLATFKQEIKN